MGWSDDFRNCWSTGTFQHNHPQALQREKENIPFNWIPFFQAGMINHFDLTERTAHLTVWSCTGAYTLVDAQLQAAILNHVNAVISVTGSEESLSLVQLDQHHVTTQLQKQRFLKVPEHPVCARHNSVTASWDNHATYQRMNMPNTDCETTDESLQWPSHSFLVYR